MRRLVTLLPLLLCSVSCGSGSSEDQVVGTWRLDQAALRRAIYARSDSVLSRDVVSREQERVIEARVQTVSDQLASTETRLVIHEDGRYEIRFAPRQDGDGAAGPSPLFEGSGRWSFDDDELRLEGGQGAVRVLVLEGGRLIGRDDLTKIAMSWKHES